MSYLYKFMYYGESNNPEECCNMVANISLYIQDPKADFEILSPFSRKMLRDGFWDLFV